MSMRAAGNSGNHSGNYYHSGNYHHSGNYSECWKLRRMLETLEITLRILQTTPTHVTNGSGVPLAHSSRKNIKPPEFPSFQRKRRDP
jgi:hypothetical protein